MLINKSYLSDKRYAINYVHLRSVNIVEIHLYEMTKSLFRINCRCMDIKTLEELAESAVCYITFCFWDFLMPTRDFLPFFIFWVFYNPKCTNNFTNPTWRRMFWETVPKGQLVLMRSTMQSTMVPVMHFFWILRKIFEYLIIN